MKSYTKNSATSYIESILPAAMHFDKTMSPTEEIFSWRNSRLHIDRFGNPEASHKIILHHGVGTNGRLLSLIVGAPLAKLGYEVVAIDMPLYGLSENNESAISYEDWLDVSCQLIDSEIARDGKPIILYGLSAGGMLAYHVACIEPRVTAVVGMCFLDLTNSDVTEMISPFPVWLERLSAAFMQLAGDSFLRSMKLPMKLICKMNCLVNDPQALRILLKDKCSAGAWVPLGFLYSLFNYQARLVPEDFSVCPVLLTQPAADTWTPLESSQAFYDRLACSKKIAFLENAGHYPLEEPGLQQMDEAIDEFIRGLE
jgi:alpha-beta hydrolase superfamily lysophospholipase